MFAFLLSPSAWIGALTMIGVVGASMSTCCGDIIATSAVISRNIIQRWSNRTMDDTQLLKHTRTAALPVDGDPKLVKWIVIDGNGDYVVGRFDGNQFVPEARKRKGDYGRNFYATMTFENMPASDPRRIQLAERRAEILADETIATRVAADLWGEALAAMLAHLKAGRMAEGLIATVERVGAVLATHLPREAGDINELPDRPVEEPGV